MGRLKTCGIVFLILFSVFGFMLLSDFATWQFSLRRKSVHQDGIIYSYDSKVCHGNVRSVYCMEIPEPKFSIPPEVIECMMNKERCPKREFFGKKTYYLEYFMDILILCELVRLCFRGLLNFLHF